MVVAQKPHPASTSKKNMWFGAGEASLVPYQEAIERLSVLVPTYRRPADLERCLTGVAAQARPADQVVVVAREDDAATWEVLRAWQDRLPLRAVSVSEPGLVHALSAGLDAVTGDLVAITDDDAVPRPDWLARIEEHFAADPSVAGVGGRDWVHQGTPVEAGQRQVVGRVLWFGRVVGNHHVGMGPPRPVDVLNGVNCAYRTNAVRAVGFDRRLRGSGAQVHWEMALGLAVRSRGWQLLYDPAVSVDHYPAQRFDVYQRGEFHPQATFDAAHNLYWALAMCMRRGPHRELALAWQRWIGTPGEPGRIRAWWARLRGDAEAQARATAARDGRAAAARAARAQRATRLAARPRS